MSIGSLLAQIQPNLLLVIFVFSLQLVYTQKNISHATIEFEFVAKKVVGTIGGFKSASVIEMQHLAASKFEGSVEVNSVKTGNFLRDWVLKGGKYFDERKHARITFSSRSIITARDKIKVKGDLTIKGITKPITIYFTESEDTRIGSTTLFSSDFDIQIKKKREDNRVNVTFNFMLK